MLTGGHLIAGVFTDEHHSGSFRARQAGTTEERFLEGDFCEGSQAHVDAAATAASQAFSTYSRTSGEQRAGFLDAIAAQILELGDELIDRAMTETALPRPRLEGERGRTVAQLKMFAELLRAGHWLTPIIDTADPGREPLPKPDTRQMQVALGPVAVFGASNFPLAFSTAGGDTASALAAGCPVVVKSHPAHPGTGELVAHAINKARQSCDLPVGVFSFLQGSSLELGGALVAHPLIKAVGFTGSLGGGKALVEAAAARPEPIPVYAEMGSTNPLFVTDMNQDKLVDFATGLLGSLTFSAGQLCTCPGIIVLGPDVAANTLKHVLKDKLADMSSIAMLTAGIYQHYCDGVQQLGDSDGVQWLATHEPSSDADSTVPKISIASTSADVFLNQPQLEEEIFGPAALLVECQSQEQVIAIAERLHGHLTATIHSGNADSELCQTLVDMLQDKAGRILWGGFPTGVEVNHSMVHGGPFPATSAPATTSVGATAIYRFTRPVCYQDMPQSLLDDALKDSNPLNLWRSVNGQMTQAPIAG